MRSGQKVPMTDEPYVPERRPIASRNHTLSIQAASFLAEKGVTPNTISTLGMVAGVLGGVAFACTGLVPWGWALFLVAAAMMQLRLIANMLDGMVAIKSQKASPVGELFNEVPDRVSDTALFIGAGYAAGAMPELGYLAAVGALFTAYVRAEGKVAGAPQEFCGPMAKQQRMAVMTLACVLAAIIPAKWVPTLASFPECGIMAAALAIVAMGSFVTALRRLWRIGGYLKRK